MTSTASRPLKTARRAASPASRVRALPAPKAKRVSRRWVPEQRMVISANWKVYLAIDDAIGEDSRPSFTLNYADGLLEIMSTSVDHERIERIISACLEQYCLENDLYFDSQGRATRRAVRSQKAAEPDSSYAFKKRASHPHLVIEVALSNAGLDKLPLYRQLGTPEVWIWRGGKIHVHVWNGSDYELATASHCLPGLPVSDIQELSTWPDTSEAIREFRRRLARKRR